jgi:hypothetical protein
MNNQVKQLIDKETFVDFLKSEINNWNGSDMYARVRVDCLQWVIDRIENNNAQVGLIDTPPVPTIKPGDKVRHKEREMKNGMVILVSQNGEYVDVSWTGISSVTYPITELEVMK